MNQAEMMAKDGWWQIKHAADRAGVSVHTVYRWIRLGQLEHSKVGGRWYVSTASLIAKLGPVAAKAMGIRSSED